MLGLLNAGAGGDPNAPTAPWGRDDSLGNDPLSGRGNTWGDSIGDSFGAGGLGLSGVGEGGAGRGEGIGLGSIGTLGHGAEPGTGQGFGAGHGRLGGAHRPAPAQIKAGVVTVDMPKTADEPRKPSEDTSGGESDGKDKLAKTSGGKSAVESKTEIVLRLGDVPRVALLCGGAAQVPFEERIGLWRERLGRVAGNADAVISVYRSALRNCEAPTWRERSKLLSMLLDAMPNVVGRVSLWRKMFNDLGASDALYRGMLARVKTPQEMRDLHAALGLKSIDPGILAKVIKDAATPAERATKLRALVAVWPDDFMLALRLMDALEDASDFSGARELGRKLRSRPDADARVRTAVGELSLRLSKRAPEGPERALHEAEARQAFGEIVEFAPDDPVARRRLGDLLRAHGWYAEAARQYETLARLAPDDASVALLLSAAAQ
jgi:Ca-activated chloride channel family protein